jgi:hypothetical protein
MKVKDLIKILEENFRPNQDAFICHFRRDGKAELFEITHLSENGGHAQINIEDDLEDAFDES